MLLSIVIEDDGRVHGRVLEEIKDSGPAPPIPGSMRLDEIADKPIDRGGIPVDEEGVPMGSDAAMTMDLGDRRLDTSGSRARQRLIQLLSETAPEYGVKIVPYRPEDFHPQHAEEAKEVGAGHMPPFVAYKEGDPTNEEDHGKVNRLLIPVAANEKNMADPAKGWSINQHAFEAHAALEALTGYPVVYVFSDLTGVMHNVLTQRNLKSEKGPGGQPMFLVPRTLGVPFHDLID
jgi:hypothetical protein